jgi:hypothetical protein
VAAFDRQLVGIHLLKESDLFAWGDGQVAVQPETVDFAREAVRAIVESPQVLKLPLASDCRSGALKEPDHGPLDSRVQRVIALPAGESHLRTVPRHQRAVGHDAGLQSDECVRNLERRCRERAARALVAADHEKVAVESRHHDALAGADGGRRGRPDKHQYKEQTEHADLA